LLPEANSGLSRLRVCVEALILWNYAALKRSAKQALIKQNRNFFAAIKGDKSLILFFPTQNPAQAPSIVKFNRPKQDTIFYRKSLNILIFFCILAGFPMSGILRSLPWHVNAK
jgi:hypothetical protein